MEKNENFFEHTPIRLNAQETVSIVCWYASLGNC